MEIDNQIPEGLEFTDEYAPSTRHSWIFRFPIEVRQLIYARLLGGSGPLEMRYGLTSPNRVKYYGNVGDLDTSILRVCKQVYHEALPVLYSRNRFYLTCLGGEKELEGIVGPSIMCNDRPAKDLFGLPLANFDYLLKKIGWPPRMQNFRNLKRITLAIEVPLAPGLRPSRLPCILKANMDNWPRNPKHLLRKIEQVVQPSDFFHSGENGYTILTRLCNGVLSPDQSVVYRIRGFSQHIYHHKTVLAPVFSITNEMPRFSLSYENIALMRSILSPNLGAWLSGSKTPFSQLRILPRYEEVDPALENQPLISYALVLPHGSSTDPFFKTQSLKHLGQSDALAQSVPHSFPKDLFFKTQSLRNLNEVDAFAPAVPHEFSQVGA